MNQRKLKPYQEELVEAGDIIGIGCPEAQSTSKDTFVYRLLEPPAVQEVALVEGDAINLGKRKPLKKIHAYLGYTFGMIYNWDDFVNSRPLPSHQKLFV